MPLCAYSFNGLLFRILPGVLPGSSYRVTGHKKLSGKCHGLLGKTSLPGKCGCPLVGPLGTPWAPLVGPLGTPWAPQGGPFGHPVGPRFPNGARISWGAAAPQTPRNARGAKAPPDPPFKSAFGLRSSLAIASSLARYRELQKAGEAAAPPAPPPQIMRGRRPSNSPKVYRVDWVYRGSDNLTGAG